MQFRYMLKHSKSVVDDISTMVAGHSDFFVKLDIKDFYLSGAIDSLVNDAKIVLPRGNRREVAEAVMWFLLA